MEREITEPIDIADTEGRLRRDAVGWSRHPIHRSNLPRGLSRVHAWNYWCITSREAALTLLVADVGIAGAVLVSFQEYSARRPVERVHVRPGGLAEEMPRTPRGDLAVDVPRLRLAMRARGDDLAVLGEARTLRGTRIAIDLVIERPVAHETVNVLVPFDDTRFQLTSKQSALPARGVVRVAGRDHRFGPENEGFACLDYGRGRWPPRIHWNWAFASGRRGGRLIGMNLGGRWTDGTGVTENGFVLDGRLHKVSDDVDFLYDERAYTSPWRIRTRASARVDVRFAPIRERVVHVPPVLELHQCMGAFSGTFVDDTGAPVVFDDVIGLAESFRGRWWFG